MYGNKLKNIINEEGVGRVNAYFAVEFEWRVGGGHGGDIEFSHTVALWEAKLNVTPASKKREQSTPYVKNDLNSTGLPVPLAFEKYLG